MIDSMFDVLTWSLEWAPAVVRIPIFILTSLLALMVVIKLASAILSIISAVLSFLTSWL